MVGKPQKLPSSVRLMHSFRFQKAGRKVVRQCLQRSLESAPNDKKKLGRLGSLEAMDGDLDNAVKHFNLAAKVQT